MQILPNELINIIYKNIYHLKFKLVLNDILNSEHNIIRGFDGYGLVTKYKSNDKGIYIKNMKNKNILNKFKGRKILELNGINIENITIYQFKNILKNHVFKNPVMSLKLQKYV